MINDAVKTIDSRPDARAAWNAVEALANAGQAQLAEDLATLLRADAVRAALRSVASERGHLGGLGLAEESADAALVA